MENAAYWGICGAIQGEERRKNMFVACLIDSVWRGFLTQRIERVFVIGYWVLGIGY
jgi:hypothetical protein